MTETSDDAVADITGPAADGSPAEGEDLEPESGPGGLSWGGVAALLLAVVFLAGVVGWIIGTPDHPDADSVDVGFSQDMITHHEQAIQLAALANQLTEQPAVRSVAAEVLIAQQFEIGMMTAWLDDWGQPLGDPDRMAMEWMSHPMPPTKVTEMAGMQPAADVKALRDLPPAEVDRRYLEMMIAHHQGGIHMADDAAEHAGEEKVRDLARRIANVQRQEIVELQRLQEKLGFPITG